eukprot:TRINITY_DN5234_c0_g1_i1.p1 TRINITY_DN5234_c0_g1~~TRINITY_DN5234_c0_g1_i1.p1  ORF type:complete len:2805 (+),score=717.49 TRINITY_DN5234_c0_g1_i1:84-8498(+)
MAAPAPSRSDNSTSLLQLLEELEAGTAQDAAGVDSVWILMCSGIVFLMQLGFAYTESAGVRSKNAVTVLFHNLGDCCIAALCWWATGFGLAFGDNGSSNAGVGTAAWFLTSHGAFPAPDLPAFFLTLVYGSCAVTISSGAIAERVTFAGYYWIVIAIMAVSYPVAAHWVWSDAGWLSARSSQRLAASGLLDFAGGAVVHCFGGATACCAAWWIGPRRLPEGDIFDSAVARQAVRPHDTFRYAAGTLMLWFTWMAHSAGGITAFSGGGHPVGVNAAIVTLLSGAAAGLVGMLHLWTRERGLDLCQTCGAVLAGLVGSTAPCGYVAPAFGPCIGVGSAACYFAWRHALRRYRIDDALDASSVHLAPGVWGVLAAGLFADAERIRAATGTGGDDYGLLLGGGVYQLGMQLLGAVCVLAWSGSTCSLCCWLLQRRGLLRVSPDAEEAGCDAALCGETRSSLGQLESDAQRDHLRDVAAFPADVSKLSLLELNELDKGVAAYVKSVTRRVRQLRRLGVALEESQAQSASGSAAAAGDMLTGVNYTSEKSLTASDLANSTLANNSWGTSENVSDYREHGAPASPDSPTSPQEFHSLTAAKRAARRLSGNLRRPPTAPPAATTSSASSRAARSLPGSPPQAANNPLTTSSLSSSAAAGAGARPPTDGTAKNPLVSLKQSKPPKGAAPTSVLAMIKARQFSRKLRGLAAAEAEGDYWEEETGQPPNTEGLPPEAYRPPSPAPTPPESAEPPSPPGVDEEGDGADGDPFALVVSRTQSAARFLRQGSDALRSGAGRVSALIEPHLRRLAAIPQPVRVWGPVLLLLGGVTGAGAARDHFWTLQAESPPVALSGCDSWQQEIEGRLNRLSAGREQFHADLDGLWVLFCAILVFLMQLGFAFIEAGAVRSRNVQSIIFKNLGDACIGALCWWALGYGCAFGSGNSFVGGSDFFLTTSGALPASNLPVFFLSFTYATTACTIVSGAIAERVTLAGYYMMVVIIMCFSYPVVVHWVWSSDGWLSMSNPDRVAGMADFAGSAVIHLSGGTSALVSALLIGPRALPGGVDVFSPEGQDVITSHNKFNTAVGTLMLWFSWFGFNAGSVGAMSGGGHEVAATAAVTTLLAGAASTCTALFCYPSVFGHYDLGHTCNAALAGLVSVTAGCAYISPASAIPVGIGAAFVYLGAYRLRVYCRIDDVVDACSVHMAGGAFGTLCVGLFADSGRLSKAFGEDFSYAGAFRGGGMRLLGDQLLGTVAIMAWSAATTILMCQFIKWSWAGLRVPHVEEMDGIDKHLCGGLTYDYLAKLETFASQTEETVEAIAAQRFEGLEQVWDKDCPTRTELGFKRIVELFQEYRAYLPESVLNPDASGSEADHDREDTNARPEAMGTAPEDGSQATADPRRKGGAVGIVLQRSAVVICASLQRARGVWLDALRGEAMAAKGGADRNAPQCKVCWHPLTSAEFCSVSGKRHEAPAGTVSAVFGLWIEAVMKCQTDVGAAIETVIGSEVIITVDSVRRTGQASSRACQCALLLREAAAGLRKSTADSELNVTVGISGSGIGAGNVGGDKARRRAVIGEGLTDARELQQLSQLYGVTTLVGDRVGRQAMKEGFAGLREIANAVYGSGQTESRVIFHIDAAAPGELPPEIATFAGAWPSLQAGDIDEALQCLTTYMQVHSTDKVAENLHQRVSAFRSTQWKTGRARKPFATQIVQKELPHTPSEPAGTGSRRKPPAGRGAGGERPSCSPSGIAGSGGLQARSAAKGFSLSVSAATGQAGGRSPAAPGLGAVLPRQTTDQLSCTELGSTRGSVTLTSPSGKMHKIQVATGVVQACYLVLQLDVDVGRLCTAESTTLIAEQGMHGQILQWFSTQVRHYQGSVVWASDDRLEARWVVTTDRTMVNAVQCLCSMQSTGPLHKQQGSGRRTGFGLSCGPAWVGRCGGETDRTTVTLSDVPAKAEVLAAAALSERMAALAEGVPFGDQKGFCWEPVAIRADFQRPPQRSLHSGGPVCRLTPVGSAARDYKLAMLHVGHAEWDHARELFQACLDIGEDPWVARMQHAVLEAESAEADGLGATVTPCGLVVRPTCSRTDGLGEEHTAEAMMDTAQLLERGANTAAANSVPSESLAMTWFKVDIQHAMRDRRVIRNILFPGDDLRRERILASAVDFPASPPSPGKRRRASHVRRPSISKPVEEVTDCRSRIMLGTPVCLRTEGVGVSKIWEFPVLICIMYHAIMVPAMIGFGLSEDPEGPWTTSQKFRVVLGYIADFVFLVDVAMNFSEPYNHQGMMVTDRRMIALHYWHGEAPTDLLAACPWELIWVAAAGPNVLLRYPWLRLNRLLRVMRGKDLVESCIHTVSAEAEVRYAVQVRLLVFSGGVLLVLQWLGCLWAFFVSKGDRALSGYSAIPNFKDQPFWFQVVYGFFISLRGCCIGLFQRYPINDAETAALGLMSIAGLFVFAVFLGYVQGLLDLMRSSENARDMKFEDLISLRQDIAERELLDPGDDTNKVFEYHRQLWSRARMASPRQFDFLTEELPLEIAAEFQYFLNRKVMDRVKHLLPPEGSRSTQTFAVLCVSRLSYSLQPPGESLLRRGHNDDGIYFFYSGSATATAGQVQLEVIGDGDYWGEIAAIWGGVQKATLRVTEYSEVFHLSTEDFRYLARQYPTCLLPLWQSGMRRKQLIVELYTRAGADASECWSPEHEEPTSPLVRQETGGTETFMGFSHRPSQDSRAPGTGGAPIRRGSASRRPSQVDHLLARVATDATDPTSRVPGMDPLLLSSSEFSAAEVISNARTPPAVSGEPLLRPPRSPRRNRAGSFLGLPGL